MTAGASLGLEEVEVQYLAKCCDVVSGSGIVGGRVDNNPKTKEISFSFEQVEQVLVSSQKEA